MKTEFVEHVFMNKRNADLYVARAVEFVKRMSCENGIDIYFKEEILYSQRR